MASDLTHITDTLEVIRAERFPAIPAGLVAQILAIQADHLEQGQRKLALARTRAAVDAALEE